MSPVEQQSEQSSSPTVLMAVAEAQVSWMPPRAVSRRRPICDAINEVTIVSSWRETAEWSGCVERLECMLR